MISQGEFSDEGFNVLGESFKRLCALNRLSVEFHKYFYDQDENHF